MFVDSHCHLDFPELQDNLEAVFSAMRENNVSHALTISTTLRSFPQVHSLACTHANIFASAGVHPDEQVDDHEPDIVELVDMARREKVIAIGETGLDYFRLKEPLDWQRKRFRIHIRAAREAGKPLVIHTRAAAGETLRIMKEENAREVGGVMHCFTESYDIAARAMEMDFHISMSGIVTFKNAAAIKDVARRVPLDRLLVETDSPYLSPAPFRGKTNQPAYVKHVAEEIARLKDVSVEDVGSATTRNFFSLFASAQI